MECGAAGVADTACRMARRVRVGHRRAARRANARRRRLDPCCTICDATRAVSNPGADAGQCSTCHSDTATGDGNH
jgi:hypothetical protein